MQIINNSKTRRTQDGRLTFNVDLRGMTRDGFKLAGTDKYQS